MRQMYGTAATRAAVIRDMKDNCSLMNIAFTSVCRFMTMFVSLLQYINQKCVLLHSTAYDSHTCYKSYNLHSIKITLQHATCDCTALVQSVLSFSPFE